MGYCGILGRAMATRSPFCTPRRCSAAAKRLAREDNCALYSLVEQPGQGLVRDSEFGAHTLLVVTHPGPSGIDRSFLPRLSIIGHRCVRHAKLTPFEISLTLPTINFFYPFL